MQKTISLTLLSLSLATMLGELAVSADQQHPVPHVRTNAAKVKEAVHNSTPEEAAKIMMRNRDVNGDGVLSPNETNLRFRLSRFRYVDTNEDGTIDLPELTESYRNARELQAKKAK